MWMTQQGEKKLLDPETNVISLSNRRDWRFYTYLAKIFLKKFPTIELRALGASADLCVHVSEVLSR